MAKLRFFFIIFVCFLLVVFVMNKSIASYLEQKYHINASFDNEILDEANAFKVKLERIKAVLSDDAFASHYLEEITENNETQEKKQDLDNLNAKIPETNISLETKNKLRSDENLSLNLSFNEDRIKVYKGDEFLLIGDSLMQGVALALGKDLKKLGFKSTNLSKQNTGLSYKSYYDWAKASEAAFKSNDKLKVLVVLLGANDPWDIKISGQYKTFKTQQWIEVYSSRVDEILNIAKNYNAEVIWYQIPIVKKTSLDRRLQVLNEIYENESFKYHAHFIETRRALSLNGAYSSYIKDENNKSIKVRSDDGVHFSYKGAEILSKLLTQKLQIIDESNVKIKEF